MWFRKRGIAVVDHSPIDTVWIVLHDESPHNVVLGVFATQDQASAFAEQVGKEFENGVIYSSFKIGYRYNKGAGRVHYGPHDSKD